MRRDRDGGKDGAAGGFHSRGITIGYNLDGQIGDGTRTGRRAPVGVAGQPKEGGNGRG